MRDLLLCVGFIGSFIILSKYKKVVNILLKWRFIQMEVVSGILGQVDGLL
jgi:hypothetical protein